MNTLLLFGIGAIILFYLIPWFGKSYMFKKGGETMGKAYIPIYNTWIYLTLLRYPKWLKVIFILLNLVCLSFGFLAMSENSQFQIDLFFLGIGLGFVFYEMLLTSFTYIRFFNFFGVSHRSNEIIIVLPFIYYPFICIRKDFYRVLKNGIFWEKDEKL
ncbi:MAG: hypothetical protein N2Z72_00890 [Bacteroidales bacterium]|nr:hypothetical protein [Bacteroidales bacterium]